jgi:hypothetical protein
MEIRSATLPTSRVSRVSGNRRSIGPQLLSRTPRRLAFGVLVLLFGLSFSARARAVESGEVAYTGGSLAAVPKDVVGKFDTSSPTALVFRVRPSGQSADTEIKIAYKSITGFGTTRRLHIILACCQRLRWRWSSGVSGSI